MQQPALGQKIAELRKQHNLTQEELAAQCGISPRTIQRIEAGEVTPRPYSLRSLQRVLVFDAPDPNKKSRKAAIRTYSLLIAGLIILLTAGTIAFTDTEPVKATLEIVSSDHVPEDMFYSVPVNGAVHFAFKEKLVFDSSGTSLLHFDLDEPQLIHLFAMEEVGTFIIAEPGKTYRLVLDSAGSSTGIKFSGTSADGQMMYNKLNHFPVVQVAARPFRDLPIIETKQAANDSLKEELSTFRQLLEADNISEGFFKLVERERTSYYAIFRGTVAYLKFLDDMRNDNGNFNQEVEDLWKSTFNEVSPDNPSLIRSSWGEPYLKNYMDFLLFSDPAFHPDTITTIREKGLFHSWLLEKSDKLQSPEIREFFLASYLYSAAYQKHYEKELIPLFDEYTKQYPESKYTPFVEPLIEPVRRYNREEGEVSIVIRGKEDPINSLEEFIALYRGERLYIDVWATWCGPCKEAFELNESLQELLDSYNIKKVYISIDEDSKVETWEKMIGFYGLEGDHIRTNKAFHKDLFKQYSEHGRGIEIPWYILVNEEGKIISRHAPSPEKLPQLEDEIKLSFVN